MFASAERLPGSAPFTARLGSVIRPAVSCSAGTTAADAAALMTRERTSWLLVPLASGWGYVTEQELSQRVLATGRSPETRVGEVVATTPGHSSDRSAGELLLSMLESGVRHAPILDSQRRVLGVVSDIDLVGLTWRYPLTLRDKIESAEDPGTVIAAGRDLPRAVRSMVDTGVDALDGARMVTLVIDAMTRRLGDLAIERLGSPPGPWAWLSLGSAARREQGAVTDQDHAIAFDLRDKPLEEADRYFSELASAVTSGLEAAGIPRCHADVVAENRSLRRPIGDWVVAFHDWMDHPRLAAGRQASILFDLRRAAGPLVVEDTLGPVIASSRERPRFLRQLAAQAVDARPPWRINGSVDVKAMGLTPIVNLARSYAMESGITEAGTLERLSSAEAQGRIDEETRAGLTEAFRLLWRIRLKRHAACVELDARPDDVVDPHALGPLTRVELREAFRFIRRAQRALRRDHRLFPR